MHAARVERLRAAERIELRDAVEGEQCTSTPAITSAIGGQPCTLMMGMPEMILWIGVACVGLGFAACTQPAEAQFPHAMMAFASLATSSTICLRRLSADAAVNAVIAEWHRALDAKHVFAFVFV